ncbi:WS/DGAT/MGAT family O-acyltransferase [Nocardia callitridis]|uniref:Diacylglycerol O-acyltransferase n=1 Tax=Nocardia callitridis TaxID=648753 RepID=A0ABP9KIT3_9NOCA
MEKLTGLDASFLYLETGTQHLHVCALLLLDPAEGDYSFGAFKDELARRLPLVPQLRRRLYEVPFHLDHPVWVADKDFDLDYHVRRVGIPAPAGHTELAELIGDIAGRPLDRERPLWEMTVVEGLADGTIAVVCKYHHAAVDGIAATSLMMHLCDLTPGADTEVPPDEWQPERSPGEARLFAEAALRFPAKIGMLAMVPKTLGMVAGFADRRRKNQSGMALPFSAPRTPFNRTITPHRAVAFTDTDIAAIKEIKSAFGVKVNDVVLTIVAGVLRSYLLAHGELPDRSLMASVPVSVHDSTRHTKGINKVSALFARLGTDIEDPAQRLREVAEANRDAKEEHDLVGSDFLQDWSKYAPPNTFQLGARMYSALRLAEKHPVVHNLVVSNVPGPPAPLYFLGVPVAGMYPFGPVFHGAGLTVTVLSTHNALNFGFIACKESVPDIADLADAVPAVVTELLTAARTIG